MSRLLHNSKLSGFESREIYNWLFQFLFFSFLSKLPLIDRQLDAKPKHDFQARKRPKKKPKSIKHNFLTFIPVFLTAFIATNYRKTQLEFYHHLHPDKTIFFTQFCPRIKINSFMDVFKYRKKKFKHTGITSVLVSKVTFENQSIKPLLKLPANFTNPNSKVSSKQQLKSEKN